MTSLSTVETCKDLLAQLENASAPASNNVSDDRIVAVETSVEELRKMVTARDAEIYKLTVRLNQMEELFQRALKQMISERESKSGRLTPSSSQASRNSFEAVSQKKSDVVADTTPVSHGLSLASVPALGTGAGSLPVVSIASGGSVGGSLPNIGASLPRVNQAPAQTIPTASFFVDSNAQPQRFQNNWNQAPSTQGPTIPTVSFGTALPPIQNPMNNQASFGLPQINGFQPR